MSKHLPPLSIVLLHNEAMLLAEKGWLAKRKGKEYRDFFRNGWLKEREAARKSTDTDLLSKSILLRSAASMAIEAEEYRDAERLLGEGLSLDAPHEILVEMRELLTLLYSKYPEIKK